MHRTQITLTDAQYDRLMEESARRGASMAELVRQAVDKAYNRPTVEEFDAALDAACGAWADRDFTGEEYVASLRKGMAHRLANLWA